MPRRQPVEDLSPRALARLRSSPRGYVPTERDLSPVSAVPAQEANRGTRTDAGAGRADAGRHVRVAPPRGWVRLPAAFVGARWQPRRAAVLGVVVLGLLTVAVFGLRVLWASADAQGTVIAPGGGSRAGPTGLSAAGAPVGVGESAGQGFGPSSTPSPSGPGPTAGSSATATASGVVVVHVVGQVKRPGVQELPMGSRVAQAVEAAGGATKGADLSRVNLARVLVDGEQVRVPAPGDPVDPAELTGPGAPAGAAGGGGAGGGAGGAASAGGLVPLNSAGLAALDTLPGVGPVLAQRILDWRTQHGRFTSVDELGEVSGIGEKLLSQLTPLVTL